MRFIFAGVEGEAADELVVGAVGGEVGGGGGIVAGEDGGIARKIGAEDGVAEVDDLGVGDWADFDHGDKFRAT